MAKLYFYYSAMNAGKSSTLIQSSYNYRERGMHTLVLTPAVVAKNTIEVRSRIGLTSDAVAFEQADNLFELVCREHKIRTLHCILVDEAQFLSRRQVQQLCDVADVLNIPVLAYGLRTDFQGNLFEGSQYLLGWADSLEEIKTICHCGKKATMVLRTDSEGDIVREGEQVKIGGNELYISVCRKHFRSQQPTRRQPQLPFDET
jgi:thymidine kinase